MKDAIEGVVAGIIAILATACFYNQVIIPHTTRNLEQQYNHAAGEALKMRAENLTLKAELDAARRAGVKPDRIPAPAEPLPTE